MADTSRRRATAAERDELGAVVLQFFEVYGASLHAASEAGGHTVPQARLLDVLRPGEPMPMTEVARALHCDTSNATGLVDRLEQRGLLERRPSPTDRRVRAVTLTDAGEQERAALLRRLRADNPLLVALDRDTVRGLTEHLRAVVAAAPGT